MESVGEERQAEGRQWRNVRDPDGTVGWVLADYLAPQVASPPKPRATLAVGASPRSGDSTPLHHSILNEEIYDAPIKTQVTVNILVSGDVTAQGLRDLLEQLYESVRERKGFKYHPSPTAVYVYAFTSKERADSGMGQWIAMLEKSHLATTPSVSVNKLQLAQLGSPPQDRFGLSEQKRMEIWSQYYLVETRAENEAERQYPLDPTQSMTVGQSLTITKGANLSAEINPTDPLLAMQNAKWLAPGTKITVLRIDTSKENLWYWVKAVGITNALIGEGWIYSIALINQAPIDIREQMSKQSQLMNNLIEKYAAELAATHGITVEQLDAIKVEALQKDWPVPKR